MDCNVICIKRPNIRGWDAASSEVWAARQRLFHCDLVASIHLTPPWSRLCERAIPHEGLGLLCGFDLECGDKECLHTAALAWGDFISRTNGSFFGDLRREAIGHRRAFLQSQQQLGRQTEHLQKRKWHRKCWPQERMANRHVSYLFIASLILLMNSASVSAPWVAARHWSLSGLRGDWGCYMPSVVPLSISPRSASLTTKAPSLPFWVSQETPELEELGRHLKTLSTNYSCCSHHTLSYEGSIQALVTCNNCRHRWRF